ncbi:Na+/H+ antiporter NhaA [Methylotenera sp.]|uniref:Na+/H+ antiporter NhaA n=1 Tax=Methylotenera sp. TaxID=2051956 RepID=UPI002ED8D975
MISASVKLSNTFNNFFASEKSSGILLIFCTLIAILMTNSSIGHAYLNFWQVKFGGLSLELWINDGLMAVFFLLIGLELKRELYIGELSNFKNALLPIVAAIGGMLVPALIYFILNHGTPTQDGIGIPMATDIAFALGALAILGSRIPASLKVFVVAFAVIDDLGAIVVIALFYTAQLSVAYLAGAFIVWALLVVLNRTLKITLLLPYLIGGLLMWFFMFKSGIHATIAGVMLAFSIPFAGKYNDKQSLSHRLESFLHKPVAFVILPIFALANTGITFDSNWLSGLTSLNGLGIAMGLILGKPIGIVLICYFAVLIGICKLPSDLKWSHITGAGMLGGIGFTMSIFITNLAFLGSPEVINTSKMSILLASLTAGVLGFLWLRVLGKTKV